MFQNSFSQIFEGLGSRLATAIEKLRAASDELAQYQAMLENTFDGVLFVRDRKIIKYNRRLERMLGYADGELLGQSTLVLHLSPESWEKIDRSIYDRLEEGRPCEREMQIRRRDGSDVWCAVSSMRVGPADKGKGSVWRLHDISERAAQAALEKAHAELETRVRQRTAALSEANRTLNSEVAERKRVEQALRQSEQRLDSILSSLNEVVWSLSPATRQLLYLNPAAELLYGRRPAEFFADKDLWLEVIHPEDRERLSRSLIPILRDGAAQFDYRIVRPDGEVRWVRDQAKLIRDEMGTIVRVDGLVTDFTEQKRAQEQLIESQRRLQALFDHSQDAIVLVDDAARIVNANPAACALFELDSARFPQLALQDVIPLPQRPGVENAWCAFIAAGQESGDYVIRRSDGSRCAIEYRAAANILPGLHLAVVRDVTVRKQAEEAQREGTERLRGLSSHLQSVREEQSARIAREMHDELGGSLTMLKLGLASLLDKADDPPRVRQQLTSMLALTNDSIQSVKRISMSLHPVMLDTLGLLATIRRHVAEFSQLTGIDHELHLPEYLSLASNRSTAVFRIIQEALTNVARHAEATKLEIAMRHDDGWLIVEITDDGKGVTDAVLAKPASFGILGMRERSRYVGGELIIQGTTDPGTPDRGTKVVLRLPLEQESA